jgi:Tol biopolymer transport system component
MKSPLTTRSVCVAPLLILLTVAAALAVAACGKISSASGSAASPSPAANTSASPRSAVVAEATHNLKPSHPSGLIAFVKLVGKESYIYVVRPDGTGLKRLAHLRPKVGSFQGKPAWSPDGSRIGFLSGGAVWVMNADGSHQRQVTAANLGIGALAWSPDGGQMVLTMGSDGHLAIMNADGSSLKRVISESGQASYHGPAWAANGRIYFARHDDVSDLGEISSVNADGSGLTVVTAAWEDSFSLSHDGKWLLIFEGMEQTAVRLAADGRGREQVVLSKGVWDKYHARGWSASSWSPEDRWIAFAGSGFVVMGGPPSSGLWVVKSDGYWDPRRLSGAGTKVFDPAWQPQ